MEIRRVAGSRKYKKWRSSVFRRDNYKCQMCEKKSEGDIEAHHIIPIEEEEEKILDVENGITLCVDCHRSIRHKESDFISIFKEKIKKK